MLANKTGKFKIASLSNIGPHRGLLLDWNIKWFLLYLLCQSRRLSTCSEITIPPPWACTGMVVVSRWLGEERDEESLISHPCAKDYCRITLRRRYRRRGLPFRTSAKCFIFLIPLCPQIHPTSLTKVAYYVCFWWYPPPPSADVINGIP